MQLPVQWILPNPDGRGQEHLMPVCVVQTVQKGPSGVPPFATMAILPASLATMHPWLHSLPPRAPGKDPRVTRRWMRWSAGTGWLLAAASALPLSLSCRARNLVARRVLPGRAVRRSQFLEVPWLAFPASSSCRGLVSFRQAPLAGALSSRLKHFVLEWLQRNQRRTLAVTRQALPRGAAIARAQVRGTRVPLL